MISSDLVRARRRGEKLILTKLSGADREVAHGLAEELLLSAGASVGENLEELEAALDAVDHEARHQKLFQALRKLTLDGCELSQAGDVDSVSLRREVFTQAAAARRALEPGEHLSRETIVESVAGAHGLSAPELELGLFGDLKGAQRLLKAPPVKPDELLERHQLAEIQGILLRAVKLSLKVECKNPGAYRRLFHKLKFRQLLYSLKELPGGCYQIDIDGPFSLFDSVTKYGLQLALLVPALLECESVHLHADLRWGKERRTLAFEHQLACHGSAEGGGDYRPEVEALLEGINKNSSPWTASSSEKILDLPGVGVVIPDLVLTKPGACEVYLEVMGYWSREAVWQRVEWAERRGSGAPVLFAVSSRLRVSEDVVPEDASAALLVYKGAISVKAALTRADTLVAG